LQSLENGASESKTIETQTACTNVPKPTFTVADALAALQTAAKNDPRTVRRALLAALAALENDD
jgi:hypothetical protein